MAAVGTFLVGALALVFITLFWSVGWTSLTLSGDKWERSDPMFCVVLGLLISVILSGVVFIVFVMGLGVLFLLRGA